MALFPALRHRARMFPQGSIITWNTAETLHRGCRYYECLQVIRWLVGVDDDYLALGIVGRADPHLARGMPRTCLMVAIRAVLLQAAILQEERHVQT